jgi:hypothetical protein
MPVLLWTRFCVARDGHLALQGVLIIPLFTVSHRGQAGSYAERRRFGLIQELRSRLGAQAVQRRKRADLGGEVRCTPKNRRRQPVCSGPKSCQERTPPYEQWRRRSCCSSYFTNAISLGRHSLVKKGSSGL